MWREREGGRRKGWEKVRGKERGRNEEKFNNLLSRSVPEAAKPFLGHMRYSFIHCVAVCVCQCTSVCVGVCVLEYVLHLRVCVGGCADNF